MAAPTRDRYAELTVASPNVFSSNPFRFQGVLHVRTWARCTFSVGVAALIAACGGSQPPIGAPGVMPKSLVSPAQTDEKTSGSVNVSANFDPEGTGGTFKNKAPLLYVTEFDPFYKYNDVKVFLARRNNPSPIARITDGILEPAGDCIDSHGTLYVSNQGGFVNLYAAGKTKLLRRITKGLRDPAFCAIDANDSLWVADFDGWVNEYKQGGSKPSETITQGLTCPNGIAIDQAGDLYVSNGPGNCSTLSIQIYAPGKKIPSRTITDGITSPVGITVDSNGTLYVANIAQNNVEEYHAGQNHPYQTITQDMNEPSDVTVNARGRLYVTNYSGSIIEFAPGSVVPSEKRINKGLYTPQGTAYAPPLLP